MAESTLRRQTPEGGAECANRARSDLTGGRAAMLVPTGLDLGVENCGVRIAAAVERDPLACKR